MRPFQQLRLWLRAGPRAERMMAAIASVAVVSLLSWAIVPALSGGTDTVSSDVVGATTGTTGQPATGTVGSASGAATSGTGGGSGATAGAASGTPLGASGSTAGSATGAVGTATGSVTGTGSSTGTTPRPSTCLPETGPGVTAREILVGVVLVDIGALNSAIGIPTQEEHRRAYKAVIDDINSRGGIQCRKLVAKFYVENVTDSSTATAACLQMQEDKVYAVLNNLHNPAAITCVAQAKIPNIWYTPPHTPTMRKYFPYVLSFMPDYERLVKNYVRGLSALRWFTGLNKVGILEGTCYPYLGEALRRELTAVGIPSSKWVAYNYGCSTTSLAAPEKDTQAAVQFNREGVTHVLSVQYLQSPNFATAAEQQQYRPKYAVMSDGQVSASDKAAQAPPRSFDGALAIAMDQIGAQHTPGIALSAATKRCRQLIMKAGLKDPVGDNSGVAGGLYGVACVNTTMLAAALSKAPALTRTGLAAGLARVGPLDLSFPAGPSVFDRSDNPTGGQFWRPLAFEYDCNCWRVKSATWRKQFV